jgi:DNA-binding PadR family transcriptional regulator
VTAEELDYAILAMVGERRDYGYSLFDRIAKILRPLDIEPPSQRATVYQALTRLEQANLIERVDPAPPGTKAGRNLRAPRTRYRLTEEGECALTEFVLRPVPVEPTRVEFVIRMLCASQAGVDKLNKFLDAWETVCLQHIEHMGPPADPGEDDALVVVVGKLMDQAVHGAIQAQLDWIELAREAASWLRKHPERGS